MVFHLLWRMKMTKIWCAFITFVRTSRSWCLFVWSESFFVSDQLCWQWPWTWLAPRFFAFFRLYNLVLRSCQLGVFWKFVDRARWAPWHFRRVRDLSDARSRRFKKVTPPPYFPVVVHYTILSYIIRWRWHRFPGARVHPRGRMPTSAQFSRSERRKS